MGRRLKEDILNKLRPHEFVGVDITGRAYGFLNEGGIKTLGEMLKGKWMGERTIPTRAVSEKKIRTNNNNFSKRGRILELARAGWSIADISKTVGTTPSYVRVVLSDLRLLGYDIPRRKAGRPKKQVSERDWGTLVQEARI
jgi:hypothetical protein